MKAVGLYRYLPITDPESLLDLEIANPTPGPRDLLVKVEAIAVNPVDTKVRAPKDKIEANGRILGWDAAGTVVAVGESVDLFKVGDEVYYAGSITRPGANSEYHVVDERIAALKPHSLNFAEAAALPLTAITAWEALFERLAISDSGADTGKKILIIGGAGGVGSIAIQLAARIAKLHVIATASRPESAAWCRKLGANDIIDHRLDMAEQLTALGYATVDAVLCLNDTDAHFPTMAKVIAPQGTICTIVENNHPLDIALLKSKSAGFVWEFMFTRAMYQTPDMIAQHHLLTQVAQLIDNGTLQTTVGQMLSPINAANLKLAHAALEAGRSIGKIVIHGF